MSLRAVEQIKNRLSIVDVVGSYVELKHAGKSMKGKSPFTNEKTPSFFVSPDRGMYYCFSSQKGGDMFTFIQEIEGVDFKAALKILAEKAGVELTHEDSVSKTKRDVYYAALEDVTKFFVTHREENPSIDAYIRDRGVTEHTRDVWRVGYAPDEWRALRTFLASKGYSDDDMFSVGVIKRADGAKEPYDVFRDRIMFPLFDPSGRVVAFSGRTLKKDANVPKYVNSPETELYQKSELLYGYDKAKQGIRHYDFSLVVEGQFDVVLAHQAGYGNTVAVSGTALTTHHIGLLTRMSKNVVLALDADRAGISAMKRSAPLMLERGMDVKIARLPQGQDPADVVREDARTLRKIVGQSVHIVEFFLGYLRTQARDDRGYKLLVQEEVLPILISIENRIDREHFETSIAEALSTTKESIHYEVERRVDAERSAHTERTPVSQTAEPQPVHRDERDKLGLHVRALLDVLQTHFTHLHTELQAYITNVLPEHIRESLYAIESTRYAGDVFRLEEMYATAHKRQIIADVEHTMTRYMHLYARESLRQLRGQITTAEEEGDSALVTELLTQAKSAEKLLQEKFLFVS